MDIRHKICHIYYKNADFESIFSQKDSLYCCHKCAKFSSTCKIIFIFSCILFSEIWDNFLWMTLYHIMSISRQHNHFPCGFQAVSASPLLSQSWETSSNLVIVACLDDPNLEGTFWFWARSDLYFWHIGRILESKKINDVPHDSAPTRNCLCVYDSLDYENLSCRFNDCFLVRRV